MVVPDFTTRRFRGWLVLVLCVGGTWPARAADSVLEQLDALCDQRQYDQAERLCREQLDRPSITPAQRAELTIEFSRTLAQRR